MPAPYLTAGGHGVLPVFSLPLCWLQPYLQPVGARAGGEVGDAEWGGGKEESFLDEMPRHIV